MSKKIKTPHVKPTAEELQEGIDKVTSELEGMDKTAKDDDLDKGGSTDKPQPKTGEKGSTSGSEDGKDDKKVVEDTDDTEKDEKPEVNYKKKFVESTREAQVLYAKNKKINDAFDKAKDLPDPTEDDMKAEYTDWDVMSDFEKKMAKDTMISKKRFEAIGEVNRGFKEIEEWQAKIDAFSDDPNSLVDNPKLEGKMEEFKAFATKPSRRGVDFEDLIPAFLYSEDQEKPKNKGKMFETGTGGPATKSKPKSDKISIEEARSLRETDYSKYKELLKAGKIKSDF